LARLLTEPQTSPRLSAPSSSSLSGSAAEKFSTRQSRLDAMRELATKNMRADAVAFEAALTIARICCRTGTGNQVAQKYVRRLMGKTWEKRAPRKV